MTGRLQHIDFYQLAGDELDVLAAQLCDKSLAVGKKIIIYCDKEMAASVSRALWVIRDLSFLAHGTDQDEGAEFASIWISTDLSKNQIEAEFAITLSGELVPDITSFERLFILFNGKDEASLTTARAHWKENASAHAGHCRYFAKTDDGNWEQKASA